MVCALPPLPVNTTTNRQRRGQLPQYNAAPSNTVNKTQSPEKAPRRIWRNKLSPIPHSQKQHRRRQPTLFTLTLAPRPVSQTPACPVSPRPPLSSSPHPLAPPSSPFPLKDLRDSLGSGSVAHAVQARYSPAPIKPTGPEEHKRIHHVRGTH